MKDVGNTLINAFKQNSTPANALCETCRKKKAPLTDAYIDFSTEYAMGFDSLKKETPNL